MISCMMVTQASRWSLAKRAIVCFQRQTYPVKELVLVHDSGTEFDQQLRHWLSRQNLDNVCIKTAPEQQSLGYLRNMAMDACQGQWVCQWDDDDLSHPQRLEQQFMALQTEQSQLCFLTDQLHWFQPLNLLFWDDWSNQKPPLDLVENTLLAEKSVLGRYPEWQRGEDTLVVHEAINAGYKVTRIVGQGYLYLYTYHGDNVWDLQHHQEIVASKAAGQKYLQSHLQLLAERLAEYPVDLPAFTLPYNGGTLKLPYE